MDSNRVFSDPFNLRFEKCLMTWESYEDFVT